MMQKLKAIHSKYLIVKIATVIVVVFLSVAIMLPLIKLAELFGINIRQNTGLNFEVSLGNVFFFFLFGICSIGIIWSAQKFIHKKKITELGFQSKLWPTLLIGFVIGVLLVSLKYLVLILNAESVGYNSVVNSETPLLTYIGYYMYFLIGFVFWNSFIEELGTRAYPIEKLKHHLNPHLIFVLMGLIFALGHMVLNDFSPGYFSSLFIASYIYSLIYFYSGSIWLSVGIHSGVNWVGFSFFGTNWKLGALYNIEIFGDIPYWITEYSNVIIQLVFLVFILYLKRKGVFKKYFPKANYDKLLRETKSKRT